MSPIDLPDGNTNYRKDDGGGNLWSGDMTPADWNDETCLATGFTLLSVDSKAGKIATRQWAKELSGTSVTPSDPNRCIKTAVESGSQFSEVSYLGCRIASGKESNYTDKTKCVKEADLCTEQGYKVTFTLKSSYVGGLDPIKGASSADIYVADHLISDTSTSGSVWGWAGRAIPFEYRNLFYTDEYTDNPKIYSCVPAYIVWGKDNSGKWHILKDWKKTKYQEYTRNDCSKNTNNKFCSYIQRSIIIDDSTPANRVVSSHNGYGVVEIPTSTSYIKTDSSGKQSAISFTCEEIAVVLTFTTEVIQEDPDQLYYSKVYYRTTDKKPISFAGRTYQPFAEASYVKTEYDTTKDIGYWLFSTKAGKNLTKVNNYGFGNLTTLKGICLYPYIEKTVSGERNAFHNTIIEIGEWAFCQCTSLLGARLVWTGGPGSEYPFIPSGITKIPNKAFMNCTGMTSIDLNNVTQIAGYAFMSSGLTEIDLSKVTQLGTSSFEDCENLQTVKLNQSLKIMPPRCFARNPKLHWVSAGVSSVTIPTSQIRLQLPCQIFQQECFYESLHNNNKTSIIIELQSATEIHANAFSAPIILQEEAGISCSVLAQSLDQWMKITFYDPNNGDDFQQIVKNTSHDLSAITNDETPFFNIENNADIFKSYFWIGYDYTLETAEDEWDDDSKLNLTCLKRQYADVSPYTFCHCQNLGKVVIPNTITQIGAAAFSKAKIKELQINGQLMVLKEGAFYEADVQNIESLLTRDTPFVKQCLEPYSLYLDTKISSKLTIRLPYMIQTYGVNIHCKKNSGYPRQKIYIDTPEGWCFLSPITSLILKGYLNDDDSNTYNHLQIGKRNNSHSTYIYGAVGYDGGMYAASDKWYNATFGGRIGFRINQDDLLFKDVVDTIECNECSYEETHYDTKYFPQAYTYYATHWEFGTSAYKDSYTLNKDDYFIN